MSLVCWYELLTLDIAAARRFYAAVTGWQLDDEGLFSSEGVAVASVAILPERARAQGAPPNWRGHFRVQDVGAAAASITSAGGQVLVPPMPRQGGHVITARDPQGAVFTACQPTASALEAPEPRIGAFGASQLLTTDADAARRFYSTFVELGSTAVVEIAGRRDIVTHWLHYVEVADLERAASAVRDGGGVVLSEPVASDVARLLPCDDDQVAAFGVFARHQDHAART